MPTSTNYFKKETIDYIELNFNKDSKILDVGCGVGTYADMLPAHTLHGVEAHEPYVADYNLKDKYADIRIGDITELMIDYSEYDLIILGDVLEHIPLDKARKLIHEMSKTTVLVAVPFLSPQGESFGNKYEIHEQDDLTFTNFFDRYPGFYPFCLRYDYGVFINKGVDIVYSETGEKTIPSEYVDYIQSYFPFIKSVDIADKYGAPVLVPSLGSSKSTITYVTALWDLNRGSLGEGRTYDEYKERFKELLAVPYLNLFVYVDPADAQFVEDNFKGQKLFIKETTLGDLKSWTSFDPMIQAIRTKDEWKDKASWLRDSPQSVLKDYNNVVMSKPFMLNNARIWDPFESTHMYWIDAGISRTLPLDYLRQSEKIPDEKLCFLAFPYEAINEIHGFDYEHLCKIAGAKVDRVLRGGFFGGKKEFISNFSNAYYQLMDETLKSGYMGTEESIFSIMSYRYESTINSFPIEGNGLIYKFFQDLYDGVYKQKKTSLYIITYNSPSQVKTLLESMRAYDGNIITQSDIYLLDNSTDPSVEDKYKTLCDKEGIIRIKKDNIGICGGRQFIAEHFDESDANEYFFFEDDMNFIVTDTPCKCGFIRTIPNLIDKIVRMSRNSDYDFIKLSFSELYGDSSEQWAWNNVKEPFKTDHFGDMRERPLTNFKNIEIIEGIPVATGEIFYSNWPQLVTREGNKKMFLDTKWDFPYEQTWMSHMYQETVKGNLKPAILLASPIEHDRFDFYPAQDRREN